MSATILLTGCAGYIGSVLTRLLLQNGYKVRGLDSLKFGGESLTGVIGHRNFEFIKGDIRDKTVLHEAVDEADAVVHLAAIVGDPACKLFPDEAEAVNRDGARQVYDLAKAAGAKHFVFASTCSNYGIMAGAGRLNEDAALNPQSAYARQKVDFEQFLLSRQNDAMASTVLRFATVYGLSHRIRFDLTVNHFTRDLELKKYLNVFGADTWRPYCHVNDLAWSVIRVLDAGPEAMTGKVYNVGDNDENYTKRMICEILEKRVSDGKIEFTDTGSDDPRNYKVDFSRIRDELGFEISRTVPGGIAEILKLIRSGILSDPFSHQYYNC